MCIRSCPETHHGKHTTRQIWSDPQAGICFLKIDVPDSSVVRFLPTYRKRTARFLPNVLIYFLVREAGEKDVCVYKSPFSYYLDKSGPTVTPSYALSASERDTRLEEVIAGLHKNESGSSA